MEHTTAAPAPTLLKSVLLPSHCCQPCTILTPIGEGCVNLVTLTKHGLLGCALVWLAKNVLVQKKHVEHRHEAGLYIPVDLIALEDLLPMCLSQRHSQDETSSMDPESTSSTSAPGVRLKFERRLNSWRSGTS